MRTKLPRNYLGVYRYTFDFNGCQKLAESAANPDMGKGYAPAIGSLEIRLRFFFLLGAGIIL